MGNIKNRSDKYNSLSRVFEIKYSISNEKSPFNLREKLEKIYIHNLLFKPNGYYSKFILLGQVFLKKKKNTTQYPL